MYGRTNAIWRRLTGKIIGVVTDAATGTALSSVAVSFNGINVNTATGGSYMIKSRPVTSMITFTKSWYFSKGISTTVEAGKTKTLDVAMNAYGTLTGVVTEFGTALSGVTVKFGETVNGSFVGYTATTGSDGKYQFDGSAYTGTITFSKEWYTTLTYTSSIVEKRSSTRNASMTPYGIISGVVKNARTGATVSGVTITYRGQTTTTGSDGSYSFQMSAGSGTMTLTHNDYVTKTHSGVTVVAKQNTTFNPVITMPITTDYEVVLTWGANPNDLDSHLIGPNDLHVFYNNKTGTGATLDVDDTSGYGPETMSFDLTASGTYEYYVNDFSNKDNASSTALSASGATVEVYKKGNENNPTVFTVPAGTGVYWEVFKIVNGTIVSVNQITNRDPYSGNTVGQTGTITGTVTDQDGNALSGVTVTFGSNSTTTNSSGVYSLVVTAATATLKFSKSWYFDVTYSNVSVTAMQTTTKDAQMSVYGVLTGTVTDANGTAVSGASVTYGSETYVTGSNGTYTFTLAPTTNTLTITKSGYVTKTYSSVTISAKSTKTQNVSLVLNAGTVTGTVTDTSGTAISGVTVTCGSMTTTTNSSGVYTFANISPGTYTLSFTHEWHFDSSVSVSVTAGGTKTQNRTMTPCGKLTGKVTDVSTSSVVSGVTVTISSYTATTNSSGVYTMKVPVYTSSRSITATKSGYFTGKDNVITTAGVTTTKNFALVSTSTGTTVFTIEFSWTSKYDFDAYTLITGGTIVKYNNKSADGATLNKDVNSSGAGEPEIVTIVPQTGKSYLFYGYKSTSATTFANAGSTVKITKYTSSSTTFEYVTPPSGTGNYWNVCTVKGTSYTVTNTIGSTAPELPATTGTLTGTVKDQDGNPISGATVTYAGYSATTNASGVYTITVTSATTGTVAFSASWYSSVSYSNVSTSIGQTKTQNASMQVYGTITGTVKNSSGTAISGVSVSYGSTTTTTNSSGTYSINVSPGSGTLTFSKSGYDTYTYSSVTVTAKSTITRSPTLTATATTGIVTVTVKNSSGTAISSATVILTRSNTATTLYTNSSGICTFSDVSAGTVTVSVYKDNYLDKSQSVTVTAGSTKSVTFTLTACGTLTGTVKNVRTDAVLSGVSISVSGYSTTSNSSGVYTLKLPAGTYNNVTCSKSGYFTYPADGITITASGTFTKNIPMVATSVGNLVYEIEATWTANCDLDANLDWNYNGNAGSIYHNHEIDGEAYMTADVRDGSGPEIVTFSPVNKKLYKFKMERPSSASSYTFNGAGAKVRIIKYVSGSSPTTQTIVAPRGDGRNWYVCTIEGSTCSITNVVSPYYQHTFKLTWSGNADFEANLKVELSNGTRYHVHNGKMTDGPASLDRDTTDGSIGETITLYADDNHFSTYYAYMYHSGQVIYEEGSDILEETPSFYTATAKLVYMRWGGDTFGIYTRTYDNPPDGLGDYWEVCYLHGGTLYDVNELRDYEPDYVIEEEEIIEEEP